MSRELKFRYRDDVIKMTVYSDEFTSVAHDAHTGLSHFFQCASRNALNGIVEQFTGLKDKNGKEIYEGDVLFYDFDGDSYPEEAVKANLICVYERHNGWFSFNHTAEENEDGYLWYEMRNRCEVIGNIHENPELLKQ
jgi:uncharacterized phage protein (TIGR01671 family)